MSKQPKADVIRGNFNLGGEQAEADPLLEDSFYESGDYLAIESFGDSKCFIVARTGGGKTAALSHLEKQHPDRVVRISPEDLSLPYLTGLGVFSELEALDVHLDSIFVALWKHVLIVELLRHRYEMNSEAAKKNILRNLREMVSRDPGKQAALEYLDEFGEKFWCEADERVREITDKFERSISASAGAKAGPIGADIGATDQASTEMRRALKRQFQRVVNETQLPRLNKMMKVLDEDIFDSDNHLTYVVIDDLDRDWVDERLSNDLIRCLLRTVLDFQYLSHVKILVALRTNLFENLDFGRSGGQEEKFRSLMMEMRWKQNDLERMLDERVKTASVRAGFTKALSLRAFLPRKNHQRGDPVRFVLDRTLMRPRDAISYLNIAAGISQGSSTISWRALHAAETEYSTNRLLALRDEWKMSYPGIDDIFPCFERRNPIMNRDELTAGLDEVALVTANEGFEGVSWLTNLASPIWAGTHRPDEWVEMYAPLLRFLFRIGFVCPRRKDDRLITYETHPYWLAKVENMSPEGRFSVHPAFHSALQIG